MIDGTPSDVTELLGLTHEGYVRAAQERSERPGVASRRYTAFHREGSPSSEGPAPPHRVLESDSPEGMVRKFLLRVPGGPAREGSRALPVLGGETLETESVVIPMATRSGRLTHTLCVSSQVGCAMGCAFCETAQMGLLRSLTSAEIVAQWWAATHHLGQSIKNIVFMGMGEPLDNLDAVLQAIEVLTDHRGPAVAMSNITVSTVGRVSEMRRLGERVREPGWRRLNLAVSINAPNDAIRDEIMPMNRAAPMDELIAVMEAWPLRSSSAICAEYVLIPGVNDADEHADELAERLRNVRCCVNVIPYNPRRNSPWPAPEERDVERFLRRLESAGQFCKRRRTKGRDTMAACGQLGNERIRKRRLVSAG
jgi:23S rRNA (adenine2503-C2)-methyltransferase